MIYTDLNQTKSNFIKAIVKPREYVVFLYEHGRVEFINWSDRSEFLPKRGKNIDIDFDDPFYELTENGREK